MDLQERLQAVQALHQELVQVIDAGERQIGEVEREREASIRRYQETRATAELRKSFLEGQMTLLSEMMQAEALKQTQESSTTNAHAIATELQSLQLQHQAAEKERRSQDAMDGYLDWKEEKDQQALAAVNGTQENSQPN